MLITIKTNNLNGKEMVKNIFFCQNRLWMLAWQNFLQISHNPGLWTYQWHIRDVFVMNRQR